MASKAITKIMKLDKTLLSGLAVTLLGVLLPWLLSIVGLTVDLVSLADGVLTLRELISLAGLILTAWSQSGQTQLRLMAFGELRTKQWLARRRAA